MFKTKKYPIGLDISDTSLKLVQLRTSSGLKLGSLGKLSKKEKTINKLEINCYNSIHIPEGLIVNGEIKNEEEVLKLINQLLSTVKKGKIQSKEVVSVLPETQTSIKLLQINPVSDEEEIPQKISEEIIKHVPLNLNEVYLDWQIIERRNDGIDILIGIAPKKIVEQYIKILEKASLQPIALEIEATSIYRCLTGIENHTSPSDAYMIIDLGASRSSLILCSEQTIYFTIKAPISGNEITKKIAESLKIDEIKAQKAKRVCGLSKNKCKGVMREILNDMITNLIDHIEQAVSFFQSNYPQKEIKKIILCGGGGNFLDINKVLFEHLKIPAEQGNPWIQIKQNNSNKYRQLNKNSLSYVTAMGLALRGLVKDE